MSVRGTEYLHTKHHYASVGISCFLCGMHGTWHLSKYMLTDTSLNAFNPFPPHAWMNEVLLVWIVLDQGLLLEKKNTIAHLQWRNQC